MPASTEGFREKLNALIRKFDADKSHYLSKAYSEAQARIDFIRPLFKTLGWDVENAAGLPHHEREVIVEKGDAETDELVYELHSISGEERAIVEYAV